MDEIDKQERRIIAILGAKNYSVSGATLKKYLKYLKKHVEFPCQLTGIEDFEWEEFYVMGPGDKMEYEGLKETQPSYKDKFSLLDFVDNLDDWEEGILGVVRRESDGKKFVLPLADLKAVYKKSLNYQLLDDYSVWFVNNR
jgi:hypothetical protein